MGTGHGILVLLEVVSPFLFVFLFFIAVHHCRHRSFHNEQDDGETGAETGEVMAEQEELITFPGGEDLTVQAILDAPGEVVSRSGSGSLYKAWLGSAGGCHGGPLLLLHFVKPASIRRAMEILPAAQLLGSVRHPNLVPLWALYVGSHGEKLLVHPFFPAGTLSQFLKEGNVESHRWEVIHKLSVGIALGLDHLHNGLQRPLIHGNLNSQNVLLDADYQPRLSHFCLHRLLNPSSAQEMLDGLAAQGCKAPEVIKMKDVTRESDIYSLGVVFLEMVIHKDTSSDSSPTHKCLHLPNSFKDPVSHCEISGVLIAELLSQISNQNCDTEGRLLMFFQLAIMCCSPSPSSRPDIKHVLTMLDEIGSATAAD